MLNQHEFNCLNFDEIYLILSHLSLKDKIKYLRVCTVWNEALSKLLKTQRSVHHWYPYGSTRCSGDQVDCSTVHQLIGLLARVPNLTSLHTFINFQCKYTNYNINVVMEQLISAINHSNHHLKKLVIIGGHKFLWKHFMDYNFSNLEVLQLEHSDFGESFEKFLRKFPKLNKLYISNWRIGPFSSLEHVSPNLKKFAYYHPSSYERDVNDEIINALIKSGANESLESIVLNRINESLLERIKTNFKNLKSLSLPKDTIFGNQFNFSHFKNLTCLDIFFPADVDMSCLLKKFHGLKITQMKLDRGTRCLPSDIFRLIAQKFQFIQVLEICGGHKSSSCPESSQEEQFLDQDIDQLKKLNNLVSFYCSFDHKFTDKGIISLISSHPRLSILKFRRFKDDIFTDNLVQSMIKKASENPKNRFKFSYFCDHPHTAIRTSEFPSNLTIEICNQSSDNESQIFLYKHDC